MQNSREEVRRFLELQFENVKSTPGGFKFNKNELDGKDLECINACVNLSDVTIKRSGTGVVVIINKSS